LGVIKGERKQVRILKSVAILASVAVMFAVGCSRTPLNVASAPVVTAKPNPELDLQIRSQLSAL
jgi:hypothetical protein